MISSSPGAPPVRAGGRRCSHGLRLAVPLLLLTGLVTRLGTGPFERSLSVLRPGPIAAALLIGVVTTVAQAMRWRTVATGYGTTLGLTRGRAVQECYRSTLLNAVLPGGVMGDAVRAWRHRPAREHGLRTSAKAVIGERLAGTVLLLVCVAAVTARIDARIGALALVAAIVAGLAAVPSLRRLTLRGQLAVWGWSAVFLASLVVKFALAAAVLGTVPQVMTLTTLAVVVLAGMSVPVGIGGFGPREAVAAVAFASVGLSADSGVATSAAYGVLAAVSALPGVVVMLLERRPVAAAAAPAIESLPADRVDAPVVRPVRPDRPLRHLRPAGSVALRLAPTGLSSADLRVLHLDDLEPAGRLALATGHPYPQPVGMAS